MSSIYGLNQQFSVSTQKANKEEKSQERKIFIRDKIKIDWE